MKIETIKTIKGYIRDTDISYAEIYRRAEKGGLKVEYRDSAEDSMIIAIARDKNHHAVSSCYPRIDRHDKEWW